jgi:hypothetical protein
MSRRVRNLGDDLEANPADWESIRTESVPSTNRRNRGGSSVQELFRHRTSGEEIVRHTLLKPDGTLFDTPHYRFNWN